MADKEKREGELHEIQDQGWTELKVGCLDDSKILFFQKIYKNWKFYNIPGGDPSARRERFGASREDPGHTLSSGPSSDREWQKGRICKTPGRLLPRGGLRRNGTKNSDSILPHPDHIARSRRKPADSLRGTTEKTKQQKGRKSQFSLKNRMKLSSYL